MLSVVRRPLSVSKRGLVWRPLGQPPLERKQLAAISHTERKQLTTDDGPRTTLLTRMPKVHDFAVVDDIFLPLQPQEAAVAGFGEAPRRV